MIKVEKDFSDVPEILNNQKREDAFNSNVSDEAFNHGKTLYKPQELKNRLHVIYNKKCVYCEDTLLNSPKHIEHYRPKDIYFWLAYSWDNLLLCCTSCNGSKGVNFETRNQRVTYNSEIFENIHNLGNSYDELEKPMLINPEKEDIQADLIFNRDSNISSENPRVDYTIETCNLNREELRELREEIVEDFIGLVNEYHLLFDENNNQGKRESVKGLILIVKQFIQKCNKEKKFYSLRYFILSNIDIFVQNIEMKSIVNSLIVKLRTDEN
ncbi:HNH endonuclease [Sulfurimonas sp.]|uniref:HNH endonuclease n=1 Tax=Sulfurimonas sp. TaxID=2022749 RepID=UPI002AB02F4C|nr:HNH endonuclease [Sulfurimonas sp.]